MEYTCRLYLCGCCRKLVIICSHCDRGHIYCSEGCSKTARLKSKREANRRYQKTRQGRFNHAERARRYRCRQQKVTHQGSTLSTSNDVLIADSVSTREATIPAWTSATSGDLHCHFCGRRCSGFVRQRFLPRNRVPNINQLE